MLEKTKKGKDERGGRCCITGLHIITMTTENAQRGDSISINLAGNEIMRVKWMLMDNASFRLSQPVTLEDHGDSLNNWCMRTDVLTHILYILKVNTYVLGAVQPSLGSAHNYLSSGFPQDKAFMEMDSHLARTSSPRDSVRICKICAACRPFSLSLYW